MKVVVLYFETVNAELRIQRGKVTDLKYDLMQLDKQIRLLDIDWIQGQLKELKSVTLTNPSKIQFALMILNTYL